MSLQKSKDDLGCADSSPFAIVEPSSGKAVGMTTYMNADAANRRIEIG
ncbi:MAG: hypothetical protein P8K08_02995 [Fuerstiella sp.]|nr:hypothetical protein [Fuerstiella sp.]